MNDARYRRTLLVVLMLILASNYIDRFSIAFFLQDIKQELHLSDTKLGLLTGIAFALFYAVMGIPIARWADRGNRATIIVTTTGLWGVGVALCGAAGSFAQLLLIRIGVAVGEAGCQPPALSLISDAYPRAERPRAVSCYMIGIPLAMCIGSFAAGWLNELIGWRLTFVFLGLPGLILAIVAYIVIREPRRERNYRPPEAEQTGETTPGAWRCLRILSRNAAFRMLLVCLSLQAFFVNGTAQWQPAFFIRSFGLQTGEIGTWTALIAGIIGGLGTYFGGDLAARFAPNDEARQLKVVGGLLASLTLIKGAVFLAPSPALAFAMLAAATLVGTLTNGPLFAATQTIVPPSMRATAFALILLFSNLIGMGIGPLVVGMLSDASAAALGAESLRYALVSVAPAYLVCGYCAWRAGCVLSLACAPHEPTGSGASA